MSFFEIFDPMVKAHFKKKYANSGGGGGGADGGTVTTPLCAATENLFSLYWDPAYADKLESCTEEWYGLTAYKIADVLPALNREINGRSLSIMFVPGSNTQPDYLENLVNIEGGSNYGYLLYPSSSSAVRIGLIYFAQTQVFADGYNLPSPGVWFAPALSQGAYCWNILFM